MLISFLEQATCDCDNEGGNRLAYDIEDGA
jgi:hypothetical protein